ncbi:MAG TPA: two-component sensor histidine kinase, partial [Paraburkholderia sp.]
MKLSTLLRWPRTLFARLALILFVSLALVQTLSVWLTMTERDQTMTNVMMGYIEREVTSSVALLDHLPANERAEWLPRLARRTYTFNLGPGVAGAPPDAKLSARVAQSIADGIGKRYPLTANAVPGDP